MQIPKNSEIRAVSIAEEIFRIPAPFKEGHVCTANEAAALNQLLAENVRNNKYKRFKKLKDAGAFDLEEAQKEINEYLEAYEFGSGTNRSSDPIYIEAKNIASQHIKESLKKEGYKLVDIPQKRINELSEALINKNPKILDIAARIVREREELGSAFL